MQSNPVLVTGGAETFSDVPIRFSKPIRKRLLQVSKASKKGPMGVLGLLKGLTLKDFTPEAPAIANYTTGEVMVSLDNNYICGISFCYKIPHQLVKYFKRLGGATVL